MDANVTSSGTAAADRNRMEYHGFLHEADLARCIPADRLLSHEQNFIRMLLLILSAGATHRC
jgi:hypothetical protein